MEQVIEQALALISSAEGASIAIALVLEVVFRLIPSEKPLGIIIAVASIAKGVGQVLIKFSELLNKVIPQKVK
jgi:hypothetical protein